MIKLPLTSPPTPAPTQLLASDENWGRKGLHPREMLKACQGLVAFRACSGLDQPPCPRPFLPTAPRLPLQGKLPRRGVGRAGRGGLMTTLPPPGTLS